MEDKKMQVIFAPNIKSIDKLGANWYNIVLDITSYLEEQGFHYDRSLGFINDREMSKKEVLQLMERIIEISLGKENLLCLNVNVIGKTIDLTSLIKGMN